MHYLHIIYSGIVEKTSNVGKKQVDVTEIRYFHPIWKENHILIEFPPMVANTKLRLHKRGFFRGAGYRSRTFSGSNPPSANFSYYFAQLI